MTDFRNEVLEYLLANSGTLISIHEIIEKHFEIIGSFPEGDNTMPNSLVKANQILRELEKMEWINLYPQGGIQSGHMRIQGTMFRHFNMYIPVKARMTLTEEIEYKKMKQIELPKSQSINVLGDNKGAILLAGDNAHQSIDNVLISPKTQNTTNNKPPKPVKRSSLEITAWVVGIAAGLFVIWEFVLKRFFKMP